MDTLAGSPPKGAHQAGLEQYSSFFPPCQHLPRICAAFRAEVRGTLAVFVLARLTFSGLSTGLGARAVRRAPGAVGSGEGREKPDAVVRALPSRRSAPKAGRFFPLPAGEGKREKGVGEADSAESSANDGSSATEPTRGTGQQERRTRPPPRAFAADCAARSKRGGGRALRRRRPKRRRHSQAPPRRGTHRERREAAQRRGTDALAGARPGESPAADSGGWGGRSPPRGSIPRGYFKMGLGGTHFQLSGLASNPAPSDGGIQQERPPRPPAKKPARARSCCSPPRAPPPLGAHDDDPERRTHRWREGYRLAGGGFPLLDIRTLLRQIAHGMSDYRKNVHQITHNGLVYTYPDGSQDILCATAPIFRESGWELSNKWDSIHVEKSVREAGKKSEGEDALRSMRRARAKLRRLALANDFRYFVTLTLDAQRIDRYDGQAVVKALSRWADNMVRRAGLRYILVPELHKDGAFHFHGFFAGDGVKVVDSGVKWDNRPVFNLPQWKFGFSTAQELYGDYCAAVGYCCKYIGKQDGQRPLGRWYYSGGALNEPRKDYADLDYNLLDSAAEFSIPGAKIKISRKKGE